MRPVYKRENLIITEFDEEDVITTSMPILDTPTVGPFIPHDPSDSTSEKENSYRKFSSFDPPGSWF